MSGWRWKRPAPTIVDVARGGERGMAAMTKLLKSEADPAVRAAVPESRFARDRPDRHHPALSRPAPRARAEIRGRAAVAASVAAHHRRSGGGDPRHPSSARGVAVLRGSARSREDAHARNSGKSACRNILGYFERVLAEAGGTYVTGRRVELCRPVAVPDRRRAALRLPAAGCSASSARSPAWSSCTTASRRGPNIAAYLASDRRIPFNEDGIFRHYKGLDKLTAIIIPATSCPGLRPASALPAAEDDRVDRPLRKPGMTTDALTCSAHPPASSISDARSMPSMQATLSATTSLPSGLTPRANTSTPQSRHSWWRIACLLNRYSFRLSAPARS